MALLERETLSPAAPEDDSGRLDESGPRVIRITHRPGPGQTIGQGGAEGVQALGALASRLADFAELAPGWDSYGARSIRHTAIQQTFDILAYLLQSGLRLPSGVVPTSSGGTQLEWSVPGLELEVEIEGDSHFDLLLETPDNTVEQSVIGLPHLLSCISPYLSVSGGIGGESSG